MKLNLNDIIKITNGSVKTEETKEGFAFHRFTEEEEALYRITSLDFFKKTASTSGVTLSFKTDSKKLFIDVLVKASSSRSYFAIDLAVNGELVDSLNNYSELEIPDAYTTLPAEYGDFSKSFTLGDGEKEITLYLPWSVETILKELSLDDGSKIIPLKRSKKLLAYGDSITHGYDALNPRNKYITRFADAVGYEEYNKAIGGEIFFPALSKIKQPFTPDLITVAYGTNDWSKTTKDVFLVNCKAFYENLANNYPDTPILALTPIWRLEAVTETRPFGDFFDVERGIREATKNIKNVKVVNCYDFVPHERGYFADLRLHPNDEGFKFYFEGLLKEAKSVL